MKGETNSVSHVDRAPLRGVFLTVLTLVSSATTAQNASDAEAVGAGLAAVPGEVAEQPAADAIVTRFELQIEFEDLLAAENYAAAAALVEQLITLAEQEFGGDSTLFAATLIQAAEAQTLSGNFEAAEDTALRALEIHRAQDGAFSESLIRPYLVLGDNFQAAGDHISAMPAYGEARNISRRVNGLLNPGQIEILDRMSASAEGLDQMTEARDYQLDALMLVERRYEPHSPEVVEGALRYGTWLREHNMFTPERELYARIERQVADQHGQESVELVPLLLARANSFRSQSIMHPLGISGLRLAREILEPDPNPRMLAEVHRDLGDWEAAFNERGADGSAYLTSWALLGDVENGEALREDWYGAGPAQFVLIAARGQRGFSMNQNAATGRLVIRFTVDPTGETSDVRITDAEPPGIADEAFARQIRNSRFRPMIRDGRLVAARRAFSATFRYDADDYDQD